MASGRGPGFPSAASWSTHRRTLPCAVVVEKFRWCRTALALDAVRPRRTTHVQLLAFGHGGRCYARCRQRTSFVAVLLNRRKTLRPAVVDAEKFGRGGMTLVVAAVETFGWGGTALAVAAEKFGWEGTTLALAAEKSGWERTTLALASVEKSGRDTILALAAAEKFVREGTILARAAAEMSGREGTILALAAGEKFG